MYKKTIKRGNNSYSYYYHNYRQGSKVKNVFLGDNLKEAKSNLNKINNNIQVPIPNRIPSINSGAILTIMFLLLLGIGLYALNPDSITGLAVNDQQHEDDFIITIQALPTNPTGLSPSNNSVLTDLTPNLNWTNATDADGDALTYSVDIAIDSAFNTVVYSASSIASGPSPTGHNVSTELNRSIIHFWRIRAVGGSENGPYSYGNFSIAHNPNIISAFAYPTYIIVNRTQTLNLTVRSNQSSAASFTNLTITDPNGINSNLTLANTTIIAGQIYEYNFTFTPKAVGTYNLAFTLNDTNYPGTNATQMNFTFYSVNAESVNFNGTNSKRMTIKDIETNELLYQGSNITKTNFPPGYYYLEILSTDNKVTLVFANATLNATTNETFNYTDINDSIALPVAGTTNINQFELNTSLSYTDANITYNYLDNISNVNHEESLAIFKCNSGGNCTWERLNRTIYENQDNLSTIFSSFSIFGVLDQSPLNTTTTTTTTTSSAGGGGGTVLADISIIQPSPVTLFKDDTSTITIIVKNNGEKTLSNIKIEVELGDAQAQDISVTANPDNILNLAVGEQAEVELIVTNLGLEVGQYEIKVSATSSSPRVTDDAKFFVGVTDPYVINRKNAEAQFIFIDELFSLNEACVELNSLVQQAKTYFNNEEFDKALEYANNAIESCKNLVERQGGELVLNKETGPFSGTVLWIIEAAAAFFALMIIYGYYRRWRFKQGLRKR